MARTVLVVDDEPHLRELAALSLERVGGFAVLTAGSAEECLAAVAEHGPDLVLLDAMMPGTDGPGTLARLRAAPAGAAVPVVFLTASVQRHQVAQLGALDVLGVLSKPFDPMELSAQVCGLAGWHGP
ncbi:response regulator [Kineococcus radiotolerans]|uniref:Response regulator receiver protein n=1 Tax=Kineococcus radiotolerans (strain ATCC BAA-149 / DSM 14245 / SRS30216) TaxID=266940 RepID=A6W4T4_KINRD|nr:response regulator [Kineococcus radiotolerans]ABS01823.1 response regulator receiver protein [Kineococcus radiotolerans SRS30216 = ATCC BAA-149]